MNEVLLVDHHAICLEDAKTSDNRWDVYEGIITKQCNFRAENYICFNRVLFVCRMLVCRCGLASLSIDDLCDT